MEKTKEIEKQLSKYDDEQNMIKELETKAKYFMTLGMNRNSSALTKQGKVLWERAQRMRENGIKKPIIEKKLNISFQEKSKSSKKIIELKNFSILIDKNKLLDNVNLEIYAGDRVALLGSNGCGKSTLVKAIMGNCSLEHNGSIFVGPNVKIGYIPQIIEFENKNQKLIDYFFYTANIPEEKCRNILSRFKFNKEDTNKRVGNLSGGEKMKVYLAILLQKEVNTLIFDEPTNHIDIETKEVLEEALDNYNGTLIFISHDRYFINKFAHKILLFKNKTINEYIGNYDENKNKLL